MWCTAEFINDCVPVPDKNISNGFEYSVLTGLRVSPERAKDIILTQDVYTLAVGLSGLEKTLEVKKLIETIFSTFDTGKDMKEKYEMIVKEKQKQDADKKKKEDDETKKDQQQTM